MRIYIHYLSSIMIIKYRAKERGEKTERQMKELEDNISQLKKPNQPQRNKEGNIAEIKASIEVIREQYKLQDINHKKKIANILKEHKKILEKYSDIVTSQGEEIEKYHKIIDKYKKNTELIKVFE